MTEPTQPESLPVNYARLKQLADTPLHKSTGPLRDAVRALIVAAQTAESDALRLRQQVIGLTEQVEQAEKDRDEAALAWLPRIQALQAKYENLEMFVVERDALQAQLAKFELIGEELADVRKERDRLAAELAKFAGVEPVAFFDTPTGDKTASVVHDHTKHKLRFGEPLFTHQAPQQQRAEPVNQELLLALNSMLTHMGMDEDDWNKPTFDQARRAIANAKPVLNCGMCGYTGKDTDSIGQCPKCRWDELKAVAPQDAKDAERYRWLRNVGDKTWQPFAERWGFFAPQAEAYIDTAIAAQKGAGE